ncbi:hypothetical protein OnM2_107017 [Erysiphe neolycopersici]|uniref:Uncharacterized protein n=1 Tax=Erysiphe neolycopersici TaxID=212602 RepID=A0A420H747_9PEZI|nr:hypothetical protein OnM2_107017 [Erysiphe neolycopersici]
MSSPPDTNVEIDRENWGKIKINPDSKNITAAQINSYILWTIQVYNEMKYRDTELWMWVAKVERISRSKCLQAILDEDKEHQWTESEISEAMRDEEKTGRVFNSYNNPRIREQEAASRNTSAAASVVNLPVTTTYKPEQTIASPNRTYDLNFSGKQKSSEFYENMPSSSRRDVYPARAPEAKKEDFYRSDHDYGSESEQQARHGQHWKDRQFHGDRGNFGNNSNSSGGYNSRTSSREEFQHLLIDTEGVEGLENGEIMETYEGLEDLKIEKEYGTFLTEMGEIDGF